MGYPWGFSVLKQNLMSNPFKHVNMKTVKLFVVAAVATVAFASCGGGDSAATTDTTAIVVDSTPVVVDTTAVVPADTTAVADTLKK